MINNKYVKIIFIFFIIISVMLVFFIKNITTEKSIKDDLSSKKEIKSNIKIVKMINFYADGCKPCEQMKVLIKELQKEYEGIVEIRELDIYENLELSNKYNVMYTPTQIFLDDNGNVVKSHAGFLGKSKIIDILNEYRGDKN